MFEPDTYFQEEGEKVLTQGHLQVDESEWQVLQLKKLSPTPAKHQDWFLWSSKETLGRQN